jgi:hypothetical protein
MHEDSPLGLTPAEEWSREAAWCNGWGDDSEDSFAASAVRFRPSPSICWDVRKMMIGALPVSWGPSEFQMEIRGKTLCKRQSITQGKGRGTVF